MPIQTRRYGLWVGAIGVAFLIWVTINTITTAPNGSAGIAAGKRVPPFAVPLLDGEVQAKADIAEHANEGARGKVPACDERGPRILNVCQLYERRPVVLALFVEGCTDILSELQSLAPSFPSVDFAAVSLRGDPSKLLQLVHEKGIGFPVGYDSEGELAALYKLAACPQVSFIYRGGKAQGKALLREPTKRRMRARIAALVRASKGRR